MDQVTLKILLEKYSQGLCTENEQLSIDHWYEQLRLPGELDKEKAGLFLQQIANDPGYETRMYTDFTRKLEEQKINSLSSFSDPARIQQRGRYFRIKAAAAISLLIGLAGWLGWRIIHPVYPGMQTARLADSIQAIHPIGSPGQNKAILTLSSGQTIVLDTLHTGLIAAGNGLQLINKAGTLNFSGQGLSDQGITGDGAAALPGHNTLHTAPGEEYRLILPDGTKVWLNAASSLEFPASFAHLKTRSVKLEGEAYFEVVHNDQQPFRVLTDHQTIEDIGTAFNVSAYKDDPDTKTTLLEGAVQVNSAGSKEHTATTLKPGQQASIDNTGNNQGQIRITEVSTEGAVAWKNGYFQFEGEDIYAIMRSVSRWYKVKVVYDNAVSKSNMEGSMSRFENVSKVLNIIEKTGLFTFKIEGNTIHVSGK